MKHHLRRSNTGAARQLTYYASFLVERRFSRDVTAHQCQTPPGLMIDLWTVPEAIPEFSDLRLVVCFPIAGEVSGLYSRGCPSLIMTSYNDLVVAHRGPDRDIALEHRSAVLSNIHKKRVTTLLDNALDMWQEYFNYRAIDIFRSIKAQFRSGLYEHLQHLGVAGPLPDGGPPEPINFPFSGDGLGAAFNKFHNVTLSLSYDDRRLWLGNRETFYRKFRHWLFLGYTKDPIAANIPLSEWCAMYWDENMK